MDVENRIKELVDILNKYSKAYAYPNGEDGVQGKEGPLPFKAEQQKRDVQHQQEKGQAELRGRQLPQEYGRAGYAAVIEVHRGDEDGDPGGVYHPGDKQHEHVKGRKAGKPCGYFLFYFQGHGGPPFCIT